MPMRPRFIGARFVLAKQGEHERDSEATQIGVDQLGCDRYCAVRGGGGERSPKEGQSGGVEARGSRHDLERSATQVSDEQQKLSLT